MTSGQDGGVGRYILPPQTTKRRTKNKFKSKKTTTLPENQTVWKYETKELKKKHSSRLVGGGRERQPGQRECTARQWLEGRVCEADWVVPHSCADKLGGTTGEGDRPNNPGFQGGEIKPQNLSLKKPVRVAVAGEIPNLTGEFTGDTHKVLELTKPHPPGNQC